jgi:heat shock protein HslJ
MQTQASWTLPRLLVDGQEQPLVTGRAPTLQLRPHDGTFVGSAGYNDYGVAYTLQGEHLHLSNPLQTVLMYADADVM